MTKVQDTRSIRIDIIFEIDVFFEIRNLKSIPKHILKSSLIAKQTPANYI